MRINASVPGGPPDQTQIDKEIADETCDAGVASQIATAISCGDMCCEVATSIRVNASDRDPDYLDELAEAVINSDGSRLIRIRLDAGVNVPIIRAFNCRHIVVPGYDGVPSGTVRSDLEMKYLNEEPVNVIALIPQTDGIRRSAAYFERDRNRWVIIESQVEQVPTPMRTTPAYPVRGKGLYPWWRTGYPGEKGTGQG